MGVLRSRRGVLTLLAVLILAGLAGGGVVASRLVLPDPDHCNREQLIRWLVLRDLTQQPAELRARLAARLDEEFAGGFDWSAARERLDDARRERLLDNLGALVEPWFQLKLETYFATEPSQRLVYVDGLIDRLQTWKQAEALRPAADSSRASGPRPGGFQQQMLKKVAALRQGAAPDRQRQIDQFLLAVQSRTLMRTMFGYRGVSVRSVR